MCGWSLVQFHCVLNPTLTVSRKLCCIKTSVAPPDGRTSSNELLLIEFVNGDSDEFDVYTQTAHMSLSV